MKLGNTPRLTKYQITINGFIIITQDWYAESFEELIQKVMDYQIDKLRSSSNRSPIIRDLNITNTKIKDLEPDNKWEVIVEYDLSINFNQTQKALAFIAKRLN